MNIESATPHSEGGLTIALITHPAFLDSQSMPRFANMLRGAYEGRGHRVRMYTAPAVLLRFFAKPFLKKWAGYVDQYIIFPWRLRKCVLSAPVDTIFVFCDQALGPWVWTAKDRPHVVHAHDLLALRSAMGLIPENPTGFTGRVYQRYILNGFKRADNFVAISHQTKSDLIAFGGVEAGRIKVVHNGLNQKFAPVPFQEAEQRLARAGLPSRKGGYLLHVGGLQWYKNTLGVIQAYSQYARQVIQKGVPPLPLVMVTPQPRSPQLLEAIQQVPESARVIFSPGIDNPTLQAAYSNTALFIFPSLAEGFGWPIIEAQACGALVVTTDAAPMNEVGGSAPFYLPRLCREQNEKEWIERAADTIEYVINMNDSERQRRIDDGVAWAGQFDGERVIDEYICIYRDILRHHGASSRHSSELAREREVIRKST